MLLGKRPRPPIRRTTSMTGISVDVEGPPTAAEAVSDRRSPVGDSQPKHGKVVVVSQQRDDNVGVVHDQRFLVAMVSPRNHLRRISSGGHQVTETAHFLHTCGFCSRRLPSGRDIYMYRGDAPFCSVECRDKQMKQDERKDKCPPAPALKQVDKHDGAPPPTTNASCV